MDDHQTGHPFDAAAADYDRRFTASRLGRRYREVVWAALARSLESGDRLLELGCGTGEDAVWLAGRGIRVVATDASESMLEATRRKAAAAGVGELVTTRRLDVGELHADHRVAGPFDGVLSNFGALNCVPNREPIARALTDLVSNGGRAIVVVMSPLCPWEVVWHLLHADPLAAFRRLRPGTSVPVGDGRSVAVWYPTPRRLRREFSPGFRLHQVTGLGCFLPPPYLEHLEDTAPTLIRRLASLESRWGRAFPFTWLADHFMAEFRRQP